MATQQTTSRIRKSIALAPLVAFAFALLFGNLDAAAAQPSCPVAAATAEALAVLPSVALAAASHALHLQSRVPLADSLPDVGIILAAALRHRRSNLVTSYLEGPDRGISRARQILPQIAPRKCRSARFSFDA